jgi:phage terminase large subunit-like protein
MHPGHDRVGRPGDTQVVAGAEVGLWSAYITRTRAPAPGKIDFEDVEEFTIDRFELFDVLEVAYPRYLERSAELVERRLSEGLIFPVEPFSRHMRDALQTFYRVVSEGALRHRGDPVIAAHLANTGVERGFRDEIRVRKIDERKPIDAVPAMALAVWRATQAEVSDLPLATFV